MIIATFSLDYRTAGVLISAAFGGQFVGAIAFGYISERIGRKWAFVIALARFGTWSKLGINQSATNDIDPATQTFTFSHATYSSPYVAVRTREVLSNDLLANGHYAVSYTHLSRSPSFVASIAMRRSVAPAAT